MTNLNAHFTKTVMTHTVGEKMFEVKCSDSGVTWGVFINGKKHTDYMLTDSRRRQRIAALLNSLGAVGHTFYP